ncbi:hypothetical protein D3C76_800470 [compost metagenome]
MPSPNKEVLCTYHYDPLDRLIGLNPAKQDTLQRFYCDSRLATEIQGVARHSIVQGGDQLLAQQKRLGGSLETALLATDQQRSVMHEVGKNSLPIAYSPYGHRLAESGLTILLGFNGEQPDAITGHYLLGSYRVFDPVLMRFISPDSLSPFDKGGLNAYAYCSGNPVNRVDPTGRAWFSLTTRELSKMSLPLRFHLLPEPKLNYYFMRDALFESFRFKIESSNLRKVGKVVVKGSNADRQLFELRYPTKTPEMIDTSKFFKKINLLSEYMNGYRQRMLSEKKIYGVKHIKENKTIPRLRDHYFKQRLVMDDLENSAKLSRGMKKTPGIEPVETLSPFKVHGSSRARAKALGIREGRN